MTYQFTSTFHEEFISKVILYIKQSFIEKEEFQLFKNGTFGDLGGGGLNFHWKAGLVRYN